MKGTDGVKAAADFQPYQPSPACFINKHCVEMVNCGPLGAERLLINNKGKKFKMKRGALKEIKGFRTIKGDSGIELSFISGVLVSCLAFTCFLMYDILGNLLITN